MKLEKAFVISDIHGEISKFNKLLQFWNFKDEALIILGDLIDRGENSLKVVEKVMELKKQYNDQLIIIKGNHEDMLLKFLENPEINNNGLRYFNNGGGTTASEFTQDVNILDRGNAEIAEKMKEKSEVIQFLSNLSLYYEFGDVLFIHAGIDHDISDWRQTEPYQMVWVRNMWEQKNQTGKIIVFGHTPTQYIHEDKGCDIWISPCTSYINIDGGAVYGGQLNAIVINKTGDILKTFHVK